MALSKTVSTIYGFDVVNAYHRVEAISINSKDEIKFHVRSYTTPDKPFFAEQILNAPYIMDGQNPIKQAYIHLKNLPEFSGATDC